jgi:O-antigen/teichoic acid export membrane protein
MSSTAPIVAERSLATPRFAALSRAALPFLFFFLLPLLLFWPVLWGESTLVPFDNLYQGLPWSAFREQVGVAPPHNELVSDLVLQNYQWKQFAVEQYRQGELPLWQPTQFAGSPFLAAGQHSMLYPLSILFLVLPIHAAFGWFTVFSLAIAGMTMYLLARVLGLNRTAALLAGLVYQGSGFFTISVVFPMMVAGAAWLPLLLASIHRMGKKSRGEPTADASAYLPWMAVGAVAIGLTALAGHIEVLYYTLLVGGFYALWQLAQVLRAARGRGPRPLAHFVGWGAVMLLVGMLLSAAQLVPLYELVRQNFREGSAELEAVLGYAWPARQASSFAVPDLLGNPSRHDFYNLETRQWEPIVTQQPINDAGDTTSLDQVAWYKGTGDWKNYVEGAGYLGILPLLLTALALWGWLRRRAIAEAERGVLEAVPFLGGLSLLSLLFIFGSPLYALLFYLLPGFNQLHTPFRWIFPLTLCVSLLAGIGWHLMSLGFKPQAESSSRLKPTGAGTARFLGWLALGGGVLGLAALLAMWVAPAPFITQAAKLLDRSQLAQWVFGGSPALFASYQWENFLHLGLALAGAGLVLVWLSRRDGRALGPPLQTLALGVVLLDLVAAAWGFMPATPVRVADFVPPSVQWLRDQHEPGAWRYTALVRDWSVLNSNATMEHGLEDVRGYDSIIPKHYVRFMEAVSPQRQLDFNRVSPLYPDAPPDQELLDLLNVRFLATDQTIEWPGWTLAHEGELRVYENTDVMPRAFLLGNGTHWGLRDQPIPIERLQALNTREEVLLQGDDGSIIQRDMLRSDLPFTPVEILSYTPNEILMQVDAPQPAWLVLSDTDFPGWRAWTRTAGADEENEQEVVRANGAFRAIWLNGGSQTIRWKYSPDSAKIGFFASFLGVAALGLAGAYWMWGRIYQEREDESTVRRVAKNSVAPMGLQLFNKAIDTVFAAFMARYLGPEALGQYAFAVALVWYFIIFSNFGLGTLLTRDAARDRDAAARLLNTTLVLRVLLYLAATVALLIILWVWASNPQWFGVLEPVTIWAILLLAFGLIPSNAADAVTAVFRAYEKFEVPALVATIATFVKVSVGAGVLLAGYGIVGLAATSIITNVATLVILSVLMVRMLFRPTLRWERLAGRGMLHDALPLMINEFLATAFFRIDQVMLKPLRGEQGNAETGYYNVAYKFIDGLLILPSAFTLALFPVMSRYAQGAKDSLLRATVLSLRWLVIVALPLALLTMRYAEGIVLTFGGAEYLPASALALQILIWFLPFSFVNSLLQYVLIAADRQHSLTRAYVWALGFNLVANFLAIRAYGINGAATVTILSEVALLLPFYRLVRESVGTIPWLTLVGKPGAALVAAVLPLWWGGLPFWLAIPASMGLYALVLLLLRTVNDEDRAVLARLLPQRWSARLALAPPSSPS